MNLFTLKRSIKASKWDAIKAIEPIRMLALKSSQENNSPIKRFSRSRERIALLGGCEEVVFHGETQCQN